MKKLKTPKKVTIPNGQSFLARYEQGKKNSLLANATIK